MITIRNRDVAIGLSARASTADLTPGMIVVMVGGDASGDQPKVRKATAGELADSLVQKFIVDWAPDDSTDVDFTVDPATGDLTAESQVIPADTQVTVFMGTLVIAYHEDVLPATLVATREPVRVGFDSATNLPSIAADAELDCGFKYRIDGPEHTFVINIPASGPDSIGAS